MRFTNDPCGNRARRNGLRPSDVSMSEVQEIPALCHREQREGGVVGAPGELGFWSKPGGNRFDSNEGGLSRPYRCSTSPRIVDLIRNDVDRFHSRMRQVDTLRTNETTPARGHELGPHSSNASGGRASGSASPSKLQAVSSEATTNRGGGSRWRSTLSR